MPTHHQLPLKAQRGFTLVEIMVVAVILGVFGVLIGMVRFSGGENPQREARQQAILFIQQLQHARQQAVIEGREYGIRIEGQAYRLMRWQVRDWENAAKAHYAGLDLRLEMEGWARAADDHESQPQLLIMSSDQASSFNLHFEWKGTRLATVSGDGVNEPQLNE
ncbi:type II secretion system protein H [compost metagenome]